MSDPKKLPELPEATSLDSNFLLLVEDPNEALPADQTQHATLALLLTFLSANLDLGEDNAAAASEEEAEAGTEEALRSWSPLRIAQAIAALSPAGTKHTLDSDRAPIGTDDNTEGYSASSLWSDGTDVWLCLSAATNVASWKKLTSADGLLHNYTATTDPTVNDDSVDGYATGSTWVNISARRAWMCIVPTEDGALWSRLDDGSFAVLDKLDATADPTVGDDSADGYGIGSTWVNVTTDKVFRCVDPTEGAAVWVLTGGGDEPVLDNHAATADPTVDDDETEGYAAGSAWTNVTASRTFICTDPTEGAADWVRTDGGGESILHKLDATAAPTVDDDSVDGYASGSLWKWVSADRVWICVVPTEGDADWREIGAASGGSPDGFLLEYSLFGDSGGSGDYLVENHYTARICAVALEVTRMEVSVSSPSSGDVIVRLDKNLTTTGLSVTANTAAHGSAEYGTAVPDPVIAFAAGDRLGLRVLDDGASGSGGGTPAAGPLIVTLHCRLPA